MILPIVNTLGAFGYSSVLVQWLWTVITIGLPLLTHDIVKHVFLPQQTVSQSPVVEPVALPEFVEQLLLLVSIGFAICVIIYAVVAVPRGIGRAGQRLTTISARRVSAGVQHRRSAPMSKKHQRRLMSRITWTIKYIVVIMPLLLLLVPVDPTIGLEQPVVVFVGLVTGSFSLLWFTLQATLAKLWHIGARDIW